MPVTQLVIGTRKGLFLAESENRRDWELRGPYCESWPVYHGLRDPLSGDIYAAAASEWHGSAVWASSDNGETWSQSSEGLAHDDDRKISKVASLAVGHGRLLVGAEAAGIWESRDRGVTFSKLSTLEEQPGRKDWDDPANQPPGHLGISALMTDGEDAGRFWAIVQGVGFFETTDDGKSWTPRNRGLRADWPREYDEIGFCVHRLVRSPVDRDRMFQQNHVGMHRSDDGGASWTEITEGLPSEFGFGAATHPHDRDTFYVIPLDPLHARTMPDGEAAVWRTRDAGSSWQKLTNGLPSRNAYLGVLRAAMTIDGHDSPGLYFGTSTGQLFASADEGDSWSELAGYLPPIWSVEVSTLEA